MIWFIDIMQKRNDRIYLGFPLGDFKNSDLLRFLKYTTSTKFEFTECMLVTVIFWTKIDATFLKSILSSRFL